MRNCCLLTFGANSQESLLDVKNRLCSQETNNLLFCGHASDFDELTSRICELGVIVERESPLNLELILVTSGKTEFNSVGVHKLEIPDIDSDVAAVITALFAIIESIKAHFEVFWICEIEDASMAAWKAAFPLLSFKKTSLLIKNMSLRYCVNFPMIASVKGSRKY